MYIHINQIVFAIRLHSRCASSDSSLKTELNIFNSFKFHLPPNNPQIKTRLVLPNMTSYLLCLQFSLPPFLFPAPEYFTQLKAEVKCAVIIFKANFR